MFTLFKHIEIHSRLSALKALEKQFGKRNSMTPLRKIVLGTAALTLLYGGYQALRWAKKNNSLKSNLKQNGDKLQTVLHNLMHENLDENFHARLYDLKTFFKTHWDELMHKKENQVFWMEWLNGLSDKDSHNASNNHPWDQDKKDKMRTDLGGVRF
jgi:hypothetical protein